MTRRQAIDRAVDVAAQRSGDQAAGAVLAVLVRAALIADPGTDPRTVVIGVMKAMRAAMAELRAELDAIDSIGM